ncbi:hypothetical protein LCGC14_2149790, partial [marine sediment metagenome]
MGNTYVNPSPVADEAVRMLHNKLIAAAKVHRTYSKEFVANEKPTATKQGTTVSIKAPMYARVKNGASVDIVDINERSFDLVINQRKHVAFEISAQDMTLSFNEFS